MSSFKIFAMASAAAGLAVTAANAADLALAPIPVPVVQEFSGWYLRGDIGMTNQQVNSLTNVVAPGTSVGTKFLQFDSAPMYSLGGGYSVQQLAARRRHRRISRQRPFPRPAGRPVRQHHPAGRLQCQQVGVVVPRQRLCRSRHLVVRDALHRRRHRHLAQYHFELRRHRRHPGRLRNHPEHHLWRNASKWNLAWAAYAGLAYKVTPGLSLELTYRYVNLGTANTGPTNSFDGVTVVNGHPFNFGTITSQDVMLGFRWNLGEPEPPVMAPPLIRKG